MSDTDSSIHDRQSPPRTSVSLATPLYRDQNELWATFPALHLVRTGNIIRWLGRITFVLLILAFVAMVFVPWQQTARGTGRVIALDPQQRQQTIKSSYDGLIKYVKPGLREGSFVREDELIIELEPFAAQAVEQLEGQVAQLRLKRIQQEGIVRLTAENANLQISAGKQMLESLEKGVESSKEKYLQFQSEVEVLKAEYQQKKYDREQAEKLFPRGIVSELELVTKRNDLTAAFNKLEKGEGAAQEAFFQFGIEGKRAAVRARCFRHKAPRLLFR